MPKTSSARITRLNAYYQEVDGAIEEGLRGHSEKLNLNDEDKRFLLRLCGIVLENHFHKKKVTKDDFDKIPERCLQKIGTGFVFVSLYLGGVLKGSQSTKIDDLDLFDATVAAAQRSIGDKRYNPTPDREDLDRMVIDLEVLFNPVEIKDKEYLQVRKKFKLGLQALSIVNLALKKVAMFKNYVPLEHVADFSVTMERLIKKAKLTKNEYQLEDTKIISFDTMNICAPHADVVENQALGFKQLYRRNLPTRMCEINKERLESTLWNMLTYIDRNITDEGQLTYDYQPAFAKRTFEDSHISLIRCIASLVTYLEGAQYFNEKKYIEKGKRVLNYYLQNYYRFDEKEKFGFIVIGDRASIGVSAFFLMSLVAVNDGGAYSEIAESITRFIFSMEDKQGGFLNAMFLPKKREGGSNQVYYPGEAMTALMKLYKKKPDPEILGLLSRVFPYYDNLFNTDDKRISMAAWMSKPYTTAFEVTKDQKYADFVIKINDYVVSKQFAVGDVDIDVLGAFHKNGNACSAGVFTESLIEGLKIAKQINDDDRVEIYTRSIMMAMRLIVQSQYNEHNAYHYANPEMVMGGVRLSLFDSTIRIDNVQHTGMAILGALEVLDLHY